MPVRVLMQDVTTLMWKLLVLLFVILLLVTGLSLFGIRRILTLPLTSLLKGVHKVAGGELDHEVTVHTALMK